MPSVTALRAILGASLGLGAIDVVVIDLALAPEVVATAPRAEARTKTAQRVEPAAAPPELAPPEVAPPEVAPPELAPPSNAASNAAAASPAAASPAAAPAAAPSAPVDPGDVAPHAPTAARAADRPVAAAVTAASGSDRVFFQTRSAVLDSRARAVLDRVVRSSGSFVLEGHADRRGDDSFNEKLSRDRALAVEAYLLERGVEQGRIEVRYWGEQHAASRELWRDRRVDIEITGGPR